MKVLEGWIAPESSLLGLQMAAFSLVLIWPFLCAHTPFRLCVSKFHLLISTSQIGLGITVTASFYLNHLKGFNSKYSQSEVLRARVSTYDVRGDTFQPITMPCVF